MRTYLAYVVVACAALAYIGSSPAWADWDPGDPHKMHFPQLPDPIGWDVEFVSDTNKIGDDWQCTRTGPISDIHIWLSWQQDNLPDGLPGRIDRVGVEIYDNVDPDAVLPYSRPGNLLWDRVFDTGAPNVTRRPYGEGDQGWYSPQLGMEPGVAWQRPDHFFFEQLNIVDIEQPWEQVEGEIYWLVMWVEWDEIVQNPAGWKTTDTQFMDDAVWYDYLEPEPLLRWKEIIDPETGRSLDLAFVITPEPGALMLLALGGLAVIGRRR